MAEVAVFARTGHHGYIEYEDGLYRPRCVCGWKGPRYPSNDKGTAETGLRAHAQNANRDDPLEPLFSTELAGFAQESWWTPWLS